MKKKLFTLVFLFNSYLFFADGSPLESGDIEPPPTAPINDHISYLFFLGILLVAYFVINSKKKASYENKL